MVALSESAPSEKKEARLSFIQRQELTNIIRHIIIARSDFKKVGRNNALIPIQGTFFYHVDKTCQQGSHKDEHLY